MDKLSFLQVIAAIAVFISILLSVFLLTVKTERKLENRLFAMFLIVNAIDISGLFMHFFTDSYNLKTFKISAYLLVMPLFYLYVNAVCYSDFTLKRKHLLHLIPFIVANLILVPKLYLAEGPAKEYFFKHMWNSPEMFFYQTIGELQYLFYIVGVFIILKRYKKIYLENYTNPNTFLYKWLFQLIMIFLFIHICIIFKNIIRYTAYNDLFIWIHIVAGASFLLAACWFILKALNYPELFRRVDSTLQPTKVLAEALKTENKTDETKNIQIEQLKKFMVEKEPFLEPSLTIQELADQVKIPVRYLSILINHHMNQHFFDFVNEYRIKKAMTILKDSTKKEYTVLEILYEVGFNSKSSFHTSFKKYTNQTPTIFRNS
ncbi:histidine kinase [Elizabethkingia sp. HvH-WGS333]|uniref:helix-turn-helix domain-containing protein n=1 Tax=Elizabethkingia TaxID=308865 RepID=UPI0007416D99|nr:MULTISPECIES: helix-turn-helix transcriptional regulator [Elizabethkingia]KUG12257.1 histidine kinase [Elizabethkingia miricola]MCL1658760.1 helix-turn-helix transcriptional regulator [Elizabethkingia miricola]MCP1251478.1 helix-turn-helix transcriptional regulator [Elizabethkingia sp. S0634]OIK44465.1 histidine kinase [Elizabethkingia sp. HvH-WGS333]